MGAGFQEFARSLIGASKEGDQAPINSHKLFKLKDKIGIISLLFNGLQNPIRWSQLPQNTASAYQSSAGIMG